MTWVDSSTDTVPSLPARATTADAMWYEAVALLNVIAAIEDSTLAPVVQAVAVLLAGETSGSSNFGAILAAAASVTATRSYATVVQTFLKRANMNLFLNRVRSAGNDLTNDMATLQFAQTLRLASTHLSDLFAYIAPSNKLSSLYVSGSPQYLDSSVQNVSFAMVAPDWYNDFAAAYSAANATVTWPASKSANAARDPWSPTYLGTDPETDVAGLGAGATEGYYAIVEMKSGSKGYEVNIPKLHTENASMTIPLYINGYPALPMHMSSSAEVIEYQMECVAGYGLGIDAASAMCPDLTNSMVRLTVEYGTVSPTGAYDVAGTANVTLTSNEQSATWNGSYTVRGGGTEVWFAVSSIQATRLGTATNDDYDALTFSMTVDAQSPVYIGNIATAASSYEYEDRFGNMISADSATMSQSAGNMRNPDRTVNTDAWRLIEAAIMPHADAVASAVNMWTQSVGPSKINEAWIAKYVTEFGFAGSDDQVAAVLRNPFSWFATENSNLVGRYDAFWTMLRRDLMFIVNSANLNKPLLSAYARVHYANNY
jgi:hypothetical protein